MNIRNIFAYILSAIVLAITLMAVLAIWDIVRWENVQQYFEKSLKSLVVIAISAIVIYIIQSLLGKKEVAEGESKAA